MRPAARRSLPRRCAALRSAFPGTATNPPSRGHPVHPAAQAAALQQTERTELENAGLRSSNAGLETSNAGLQSTKAGLRSSNAGLESSNAGLESRNAGLESKNAGLQARNADLRNELRVQLNAILETRATTQGLIVNMSGVLFQNGKAALLPMAREKLAKIAGILASHPGLQIEASGFTDSTGSEASNQLLSEQRAGNTRTYLISQGVPADSITSEGFGEDYPIASNATSAGRQENRRVELVVSGEGITDPLDAGL